MKLFGIVSLFALAAICSAIDNGKYDPSRNNYAGKYMHANDGRYVPMNDRAYKHVHDNRELGLYRHIPFPYMGGYGPYFHVHNPYEHYYGMGFPYNGEGSSITPEVSKPSNWYLPIPYTYDAPKPEVQLVYGFPNVATSASPSHSSSNEIISNVLPLEPPLLPVHHSNSNPSTEYTLPQDSTSSIVDYDPSTEYQLSELGSSSSSSSSDLEILSPSSELPVVLHQQPVTQRPHKSYDDEGKWRIIRQEEDKQQQKYDYFFETENGIFAQENGAVTGKQSTPDGGTSGMGYYQYIGDDDKVYRVEYEVGPQGFIPRGDHIHPAILNSLKLHQQKTVI